MAIHIASGLYFIAHQIPYFLLAFGILLVGLAFTFKPLGAALVLPVGIVAMVVTIAWFAVLHGGLSAMPLDVMELLGIGVAIIVVGRVFAG